MPYFVSSFSFTLGKSLYGSPALHADTGHNAHALRLNVDLPFFIFFAAHRVAKGIVGAAEPCAVPAGAEDRSAHFLRGIASLYGFV